MKKLVIFDLDGTLLNTIEDLGHAVNHALQAHGYPTHSIASYPFFVGNGVRKLMKRALPDEDVDDMTLNTLLRDFKAFYDQNNCVHTRPYNGIVELLRDLRSQGSALAVASNKYQSAVETIISHYFGEFEWVAVEGHKEGMNPKPDPSIVFQILAKAGVPKSDVLYVGDSGVDIETARRACIDNVGVTWGFRPVKELKEFYANNIVDSPDQILAIATAPR